MRKDNVTALLNHATNDLTGSDFENIEQKYKAALSEKNIPTSLQIDVKNFMENLRSVLDYIAHDIYETVIKPERVKICLKEIKNIYFPYGKSENDFKSGLGSSLPDLQSLNPKVFALIESIQPYKCSDVWLYEFCRIVNEKKHDTLSPQIRTETKTMTASIDGASITMPIDNPDFRISQGSDLEVTFGGVPIRFSNKGIEPLALASDLKRTITTWVSFQFASTDIHVLPLLKKALEEIKVLSNEIYLELS